MPQASRNTAAASKLPASGMEKWRSRTMPAVPVSATGTSGACQMLLKTLERTAATLRVDNGRTRGGAMDIAVLGRPSHSVAKLASIADQLDYRIEAALLERTELIACLDHLVGIIYDLNLI